MKIGYACINTELRKDGIYVGRTFRLNTLKEKGIESIQELFLKNIQDLDKIIRWNILNKIKVFRIPNEIFSHINQYKINELSIFPILNSLLDIIGKTANVHDCRISFHSEPYSILASQNPTVVKNAIDDLNTLAEILDYMGLECSPKHKINVHIGTHSPSKKESMDRFIQNFHKLSSSARSRLTIENDDKPNSFSIKDLIYIHESLGIPIVLDFLHYNLNSGEQTIEEAMDIAFSTWPSHITPMTHYSSSRKINEDSKSRDVAHADYIYEKIPSYHKDFDVIFEAKAKEQSVLKYRKDFNHLKLS
jgi:UV DNA damage endonuclease